MKRLLLLALVACDKHPTPRAEPSAHAAPAPMPDGVIAASADAAPAPVVEIAAPTKHLSLIKKKGKDGIAVCLVVDDAGTTVGHATAKDTAVGGSDVECDRFDADGKVILFRNSRGTYAKDGRAGPTNDQRLPCGDAVFANDVSSCVDVDASPFMYSPGDPLDSDFMIAITNVATTKSVNLLTMVRGLNRRFEDPRPWGAAYCANDRLVVAALGQLSLFDAPSGKRLARRGALGSTHVTCKDGIAAVDAPTRRFRVEGSSLEPLED